jgi:hypothetical protein
VVSVKSLLPPRSIKDRYTLIFAIDEDENVEFKIVLCTQGLPCPEMYKK